MKQLNKYYVCTPFWRSIEGNKKAFVEAETGSTAAALVLGGQWKRSNINGVHISDMATVYKLNSFDVIGNPGRIDAMRNAHYKRAEATP
jgi:hypothetical protein